jgi:hypothetical protein
LTWFCYCWMNCFESFRQYVYIFPLFLTVSEINLIERNRKVQISKILKVLIFFQFECSFCKVFIFLKCYWWAIKMSYFIPKRDTNSEILHILYRIFIFYIQLLCFVVVEWIVLRAFGNMSTVPSVFYWTTPIFIYLNPTLMGYNWTLDPM